MAHLCLTADAFPSQVGSGIPLGATLAPLTKPLPATPLPPPRCASPRCGGYISSYCSIGPTHWSCVLCGTNNRLPAGAAPPPVTQSFGTPECALE